MRKIKEIFILALLLIPLIVMSSCKKYDSDKQITIDSTSVSEKVADGGDKICVYIVGEISCPGIYYMKDGSRLHDVVEAAGGFTEEAATEYINLASTVNDGEKIIVYSKLQIENNELILEEVSTLVNINTADVDRLMTLPGIGESKAKDIISYREKNGRFETIEDIMKVSGIKEAAYEKIKEYITVK